MAIAAIYAILAIASFIGWLGFHKEDEWLVVFAGMIFSFSGLHILLNGFEELAHTYSQALGVIILFLGLYFMLRSVVEMIQDQTI